MGIGIELAALSSRSSGFRRDLGAPILETSPAFVLLLILKFRSAPSSSRSRSFFHPENHLTMAYVIAEPCIRHQGRSVCRRLPGRLYSIPKKTKQTSPKPN